MPELNNTIIKNSANLKAYYRMEAGALTTDSSGNGYTLTNNNTVGEAAGKFGGAADFGTTNTDKYLSITSNIGIAGNSQMSVSFWVNIKTAPGNSVYYSLTQHRSTTGADRAFDVTYFNDNTNKRLYINASATLNNIIIDLGTNTWHHVVAIRKASTSELYVDGAFKQSAALGTTTYSQNKVFLGGDTGSFGSVLMDDITFFDTALSADQIKELYEGRYVGEGMPETSLVAGYHLNGNSTDFSGNNNHGTDTAVTYSLANGKFGQGAGISRTSYITLPSFSYNTTTTSYTINSWVKATRGGTAWNPSFAAFNIWGNVGPFGMSLADNDASTFSIKLWKNSLSVPITSSKCTWDIWHMVTGIYRANSGADLYIDGNFVGTDTQAQTSGSATVYIGSDKGATYTTVGTALIDEVRIYNVAKDANWVRKQYAWSVGKFL